MEQAKDYFSGTPIRTLLENEEVRGIVSGCLNDREEISTILDYNGTFDDLCNAHGHGIAGDTIARILRKLDTYFFMRQAGVKSRNYWHR